jgi:tetratricopeptide (TPR) repeat protein
MTDQVFVGREEELGQLRRYFDDSLTGQGQVCFVTGEAGSGKTALVSEFARRTQDKHDDLVVAIGQCDAHTGVGDPYLPFREVLCQLTGDVEDKLARGTISEENASRLRKLMALSGQVLVEVAPDLIGLFVPGAKILGELGKVVVEKVGWLEKLEKLVQQPRSGAGPDGQGLDESHVFEQYTNMLKALAAKRPLLLILDDLHWADAGSTGLLFRLGRRIGGSRILIVGTYRPEEVALDRAGQRHPLQKVLAELKRYSGEIEVDLDRAGETGGSQFVRAILAIEPNRLSEEFGRVLFERTRGHPLFTIELLRDMQERGVLVRDERGRWLEGPLLDWDDLPDRVEGIIEERIGRLEPPLRAILSTASVEGQVFTAQIVAWVEGLGERDLLRLLSQELDRRHRLVQERQEVKVGPQYLARFQFAHAVFQQYLYNELGAGERRVLHEQIANLLEELYEGHTQGIAVQLARHYTEAGEDGKAVEYLLQAGNAAVRLYAYAESRLHYGRALESLVRLPDTLENRRLRVDTLINRVASSWVAHDARENLGRLAEAERLVKGLPGVGEKVGGDRVRLARVLYWMGRVHYRTVRQSDAILYYERVLPVAQELGDAELLARLSAGIGQAMIVQGRFGEAEPLVREALTVLGQLGSRSESLQVLAYYGFTRALMGDYAAGTDQLQRALMGAQELGHLTLTCTTLLLLGMALGSAGKSLQAVDVFREGAAVAEESGDQVLVYLGLVWGGWAEAQAGLFERAEASMVRVQAVAERLGGQPVFADWLLGVRAEIALGAGRLQEALDLAEQAVAMSQAVGNTGAEAYAQRIRGRALAEFESLDWALAEAQFAESLRLFELGRGSLWAAQTHVAWGTACRDRGDCVAAREHWDQAVTRWEACGITGEVEKVRALMAALPEG